MRDGELRPDIAALFRRLLLFETFILQTVRFKEIPVLVHRVGIDNVIKLLSGGCLRLELDPTQIVNIGQFPDGPTYSRGKPPLPLGSFAFSILKVPQHSEYVERGIRDVTTKLRPFENRHKLTQLEQAIKESLLPEIRESGLGASKGHDQDLRVNAPGLKSAVVGELRRRNRSDIHAADVTFRVEQIDDTDFKTHSNLSSFGIPIEEEHSILERALLANGAVNTRIEGMRNHTALSGFMDSELSLFSGRFEFLAQTLAPEERERTFQRVMQIRELPTFDIIEPDRRFDFDRFLEIRSSKEAQDFRRWIQTIQNASDDEIREQIGTMRAKLAPWIHGSIGKVARIVISTLVGLLPVYGTAAGLGLSTIDSFLLERIFPISGPNAFLSNKYQSLFDQRKSPE